jgi:hypothetical protein
MSFSRVTGLPSRIRPLLAPLACLLLCSLLVSFMTFGGFFPRRIIRSSMHGLTGSVVITICHLSALAVPVLLLHMSRSWWSRLLLLLTLVLLVFESTVYRATGFAAGYYDYLNLANAVGSYSNAASEYGGDALRSAAFIACIPAVFGALAWVGRRPGSGVPRLLLRPIGSPGLLIALCTLVVTGGFCSSFYFRGHSATRGLAPGYGMPLSLLLSAADTALREPTPEPQELRVDKGRAHHILYIIDESVQFDVLNELWAATAESRRTGPPLPMLSYSNSSGASNAMLRHACDPRWPDRVLTGEGLLCKAKAAGYRVVYYDNQDMLHRHDGYFAARELECLDERHVCDPDDIQPDLTCLPELIEDLQADRAPAFILMNKRGSHFSYADNFRPEQARPGEPAYYTSVRVNTVEFLERLVESGVLAHTALYYTSDHGQDWQQKVPHGTTDPDTSFRPQWEVPGFVLSPGGPSWSERLPVGHWLSQFHLTEALNNELGYDDPEVPALEQALDPGYALNGDHQALFVFPFASLGRQPDRKTLTRGRGPEQ